MYRITCDGYTLLDTRDESLILKNPKVRLSDNTVGEASFTIYKKHPHYDNLAMLKSVFEISDEYGVIFRGRMTEHTRDIKKGKAVDLEGAMAYFNDSIVRPYTFPDDWEKEDHPDHSSYAAAKAGGNVVEFYLAWLIKQHNAQVDAFQQFKLGTVTVTDPNNNIERSATEYPNTFEELKSKLFDSSLGGHLCIRYEADGNYIDYLAEYTEVNPQGITYGENLRDITQTTDGKETYSAIIPRGKEGQTSNGDVYEGVYGTIEGGGKQRLTIADLPDGDITSDIAKKGDVLYSKRAVAAYGWRYVPSSESVWDDVTQAENLQTKGVEVLEGKTTNIPNAIECKAVDLHCTDAEIRSFRMYKKIPVCVAPHDINADFDISTLDIDLLNPQNTSLIAGKTVVTMTELQEKQTNEFKQLLGSLVTKEQFDNGFKVTESFIEKTSQSIMAGVSGTYATKGEMTEYVDGSLALKIVEDEDGNRYSQLAADVGKIVFNTGEIEINSDYFTLTADGHITASGITITGGEVKIPLAEWAGAYALITSHGVGCSSLDSGGSEVLLYPSHIYFGTSGFGAQKIKFDSNTGAGTLGGIWYGTPTVSGADVTGDCSIITMADLKALGLVK